MSTKSAIGIEIDGKVHGIYCHYDGYLECNGFTLLEYYDRVRTIELISLGDISTLNINISPLPGVSHTYENPAPGVTVAYARDNNEMNTGPLVFDNLDEFSDHWESLGCEYFYVLNSNDTWLVHSLHYPLNVRWFKLVNAFELEKQLG